MPICLAHRKRSFVGSNQPGANPRPEPRWAPGLWPTPALPAWACAAYPNGLAARPASTLWDVVEASAGFPSSGRNLACGALNSARLLLGSAGDAHPHGLANGSDQAGRNYMRHNNVAVIALSRTPNPTRLQKTLALNDWYLKGEDRDYPWGGIQMMGKSDGEQLQAMARSTPLRG
jgi:hypothetical protein